jgi:hypothetical protein
MSLHFIRTSDVHAGICGRVDVIRLLLAHGADVHARDDRALR